MKRLFNRIKEIEIRKEDLETLLDINPIEDSPSIITDGDHIPHLVEKPLILLVKNLYDKNIRTISSSANQKDVNIGAYIIIDYDSLSQENKKIAENFGNVYPGSRHNEIKIMFPVDNQTTVSDIQSNSLKIAGLFKKQPMSWAPQYSFKQLLRVYNCSEKDTKPEDFVNEGYHYDHSSGMFYLSKEHYDKFSQSAENN